MRKVAYWILTALGFGCRVALLSWGVLAIHWSNLPWEWARTGLAILFGLIGLGVLWALPAKRSWAVLAVMMTGLMGWWLAIPPLQERDWKPEVARLPRAIIEGDKVRLTGVRQFDYRTKSDFTVHYEEREVAISHLQAVDFFISYWEKDGAVAHTFVSFVFDNAPPVCVSIEARLERDEVYSVLTTCFKQAELIYIVGDERDIVRVRTNFRDEDVFLYRVRATPKESQFLFLAYLKRINELADAPTFYGPLSNNCTINIDRHAHANGEGGPFDYRLLLNGYVDALMYDRELIDTSVPFADLRKQASITAKAISSANDAAFSERIREGLRIPSVAQ